MTVIRELADALVDRLLTADPFNPVVTRAEYDALLPEVSSAAEEALRIELERYANTVRTLRPEDGDDEVTAAVVVDTARREQLRLASRSADFTVTAMAYTGPPLLVSRLVRTTLSDPRAAGAYLQRVRQSGVWIDEVSQRLREGFGKGRRPVRSLLLGAVAWADRMLKSGLRQAVVDRSAPAGWAGTDAWRADLEAAMRDHMMPAVERWRAVLVSLVPLCRSDEQAGLSFIPNGDQDYQRSVELHTTLTLGVTELHDWGVEEVARLEARAVGLGARIGLHDATEVRDACLASAFELEPRVSMQLAQEAIRRAEGWLPEGFAAPFPLPCVVEPMPQAVADMGSAPLYSPPRALDDIPGRYLYNTLSPGVGAGWDREVVAFHEGVPGHHLQIARALGDPHLPLIQQLYVPAFHEGWGLYAETLAAEVGLYSDVRAEIGALQAALLRAARLVVDTGLHALGWSRERARQYLAQHVAVPEPMLRAQVDRYIACPGIALSYAVGQREILRLRERAQRAFGSGFDLRDFHEVVLGHGTVPLPVLTRTVDRWIAAGSPKAQGQRR